MSQQEGFKWNGPELVGKAGIAAKRAINQVMAKAVERAKNNHPGWNYITGLAEGSVRILDFAQIHSGVAFGTWGSKNVSYVIGLELYYGSFLRSAADIEYKRLPVRLRENFKAAGVVSG